VTEAPRPRILVIAYACMPGEGSEPGTGWAWARILAGIGDVWIVTRPWQSHHQRLLEGLREAPEREHMHLVEVPMPGPWRNRAWDPWTSRFQRFEYVLWQLSAIRAVRRLARRERVDLAWHVTFANVWMGSIVDRAGTRSVLGPVGGGIGPAWRALPSMGLRGVAYETVRAAARTFGRWLNPLARSAWTHADLILAVNRETARWLPGSTRDRTVVFHHVAIDDRIVAAPRPPRSGERVALFAGRLIPWKGAHLAIEAMTHLPGWRLEVLGDGRDRARLEALAARRGVADHVTFLGWLERDAVLQHMREADVFLFPSLHEDGGWVVGEAMALGLPVVAVDRGGPAAIGASVVPVGSVDAMARGLAAAVTEVADGGAVAPAPYLERRRAELLALLRSRGLVADDAPTPAGSQAPADLPAPEG
jgi:glycosyltransferase involved in cell wall biosynthesis